MNIDETCSCGARFRVDIADIHTTSAVKAVASWRDNHRHEPQEPLSGSNRRSVGPESAGVPEGAERFTEHFAVTVNTKCDCGQIYDPATIPVEGEAFEYRSSKGSTSWCIATDVRPGPGDGQYSFKPRWPATSEEIERSQKRIEHLRGEVGSQ